MEPALEKAAERRALSAAAADGRESFWEGLLTLRTLLGGLICTWGSWSAEGFLGWSPGLHGEVVCPDLWPLCQGVSVPREPRKCPRPRSCLFLLFLAALSCSVVSCCHMAQECRSCEVTSGRSLLVGRQKRTPAFPRAEAALPCAV